MDYLTQGVINRYSQKEEVDYWSITEKGISAVEEELVRKYFVLSEKRVLVAGCGGGRESLVLSKMGFKVVGLDLAFPMVEAADKRCLKNETQVSFICADAKAIPFKDHSFDFATMFGGVLPRIPFRNNRIKALKEVRRVLKDNGIFIASVYNLNFVTNLFWFLRRFYRDFKNFCYVLKHNQWIKMKPIFKDMISNFKHWRKAPFYAVYSVLIYIKNNFLNIIHHNSQHLGRGDVLLRHTSPTVNRTKAFFHFYNIKELMQDINTADLEVLSLRCTFEPKKELPLHNFLYLGSPAIYLVVKPR